MTLGIFTDHLFELNNLLYILCDATGSLESAIGEHVVNGPGMITGPGNSSM